MTRSSKPCEPSADQVPTRSVDVIIIGAGPAGLTAASWMARMGISALVLDSRHERVSVGQADGLEPRTWEILESFGLAASLWDVANRTNELSIWKSDSNGHILRHLRRCNAAIGVSKFTEATLHQGFVEEAYLNDLKHYRNVSLICGAQPICLQIDPDLDSTVASSDDQSPVEVQFQVQSAEGETWEGKCRAKYLIGCDGAHSWTRKQVEIPFRGERSGSIWGGLDVVPVTDFPDIRIRCVIESSTSGTIMIIPRENGLVRFYTQLGSRETSNHFSLDKQKLQETILEKAQSILAPYYLTFTRCDWSTCYEVAQRAATTLSAQNRIYLCGDAIHNISPMAGMGMNVSIQDAYNLGWKVGAAVHGLAPRSLLDTYDAERLPVAHALVEFDRMFSRHFIDTLDLNLDDASSDDAEFNKRLDEEHTLIAGVDVDYLQLAPNRWAGLSPSGLEQESTDDSCQGSLVLGRRVPGVQVVSQADGHAISLHKILKSNGLWRLLVFAGDIGSSNSKMESVHRLCADIADSRRNSTSWPLEIITIHSSRRQEVELLQLPPELLPFDSITGFDYEKVFADDTSYHDGHGHAYEKLFGVSVDGQAGGQAIQRLALLRPDAHVAFVGSFKRFPKALSIAQGIF